MFAFVPDLKTCLRFGLQAVAAASFLLVVAVGLWGLLALLGDVTGAAVARGVAAAAGAAVLASLSALVLLLAWDRISSPPDAP